MGRKTHIIIAIVTLVLLQSNTLHEYYVATYESKISQDRKSIQISAKFIAHDVEEALVQSNHPFLNLGSKQEHPKKDSILNEYLKAKLQFKVNEKELTFKIIGSETELDEDFWVYIEVPLNEEIKTLNIYNAILTEVFEAQHNIMHWELGSLKKSLIFTHLNNEHVIKL